VLKVDPTWSESKIESADPIRTMPYTERELPARSAFLSDSPDPIIVKSRIERLDPSLDIPYIDNELPILP
jgi:hypothetical protein